MQLLHQLALSAAMSAMLIFAASEADAQQRSPGGPRTNLTRANGGGLPVPRGHRFATPFPVFLGERDTVYVVEREIIREVPAAPPPPPEPPPEPRKPHVVGASYASLPPGCMKMVEVGASFFYCSGEWYRQVGKQYRAVARP